MPKTLGETHFVPTVWVGRWRKIYVYLSEMQLRERNPQKRRQIGEAIYGWPKASLSVQTIVCTLNKFFITGRLYYIPFHEILKKQQTKQKKEGGKKKKKKEHSNTQSSPRPVNECSTKSQRPERNHQRLVTQITTHPEPRAKRRLPRPPHPLPYLLPGEEGSRVVEAWDVSFSKK